MPKSIVRKQVFLSYDQTMQLLDGLERKYFSEWSQNLDTQYIKRLEQPLLLRSRDKSAKLDINFDKWVTQTLRTATFIHDFCVALAAGASLTVSVATKQLDTCLFFILFLFFSVCGPPATC